mgnify:CR=1 FL=1
MNIITRVINKYFDFQEEIGGLIYIETLVPDQMIHNQKKPRFEGALFWIAIDSTITISELENLEKFYGFPIPESYKSFLQHRHFLELELGQNSIGFFKSLPNSFIKDTKSEISKYCGVLLERGYIPFAKFSDAGILCFNTNQPKENNDYSIVSFDFEDDLETPEEYDLNFESMFLEFEENLDNWIKLKRK